MRVSIPNRDRERLVRALRADSRPDGKVELTLLRLEPGEQPALVRQSVSARQSEVLSDGAPIFDSHGVPDFPPGFWPARRVAGGWVALIDDSLGEA